MSISKYYHGAICDKKKVVKRIQIGSLKVKPHLHIDKDVFKLISRTKLF
jgi:hypothetical protein